MQQIQEVSNENTYEVSNQPPNVIGNEDSQSIIYENDEISLDDLDNHQLLNITQGGNLNSNM